jgi:hypothetical protein
MHSMLKPKQADPHDVFVAAPDVVPAAHADAGQYDSAHDAMGIRPDLQAHIGHDTSAGPSVPPVDTTFRAAAVGNVRMPGRQRLMDTRAMRGVIGFLLAVCVGVAGALWQSHGELAQETVQQLVAKWMPKIAVSRSPANPGLVEPQPASSADQASADQASAATTAAPQPASVAQTAPDSAAPAAATAAPDSGQSLQSMAQDLAAARQEIEQLKAGLAQLKAGQDQMSREVARVSEGKAAEVRAPEQPLRATRVATPLPRPAAAPPTRTFIAAPVRRTPPPPQRFSQPASAPVALQAPPPPSPLARQPEPLPSVPPPQQAEGSVVRPPLPVP